MAAGERVSRRSRTARAALGAAALLLLGVLLSVVPAGLAVSNPSFAITPDTAPAGVAVRVSGAEWAPGEVTFYLDAADAEAGLEPWGATTVAADGTFSDELPTTDVLPGKYAVWACSPCAGDSAFGRTSTLVVEEAVRPEPSLLLDPPAAAPGDTVTLAGDGWTLDPTVVIFPPRPPATQTDPSAGEPLDEVPAPSGAFRYPLQVPDAEPGELSVVVCQRCTQEDALVRSVLLTVTAPDAPPQLRFVPISGSAGDRAEIEGTGWVDEAGPVSVYLSEDDVLAEVPPVLAATPTEGSFRVAFVVPDRDAGSYTALACQRCGQDGQLADTEVFTVLPPGLRPLLDVTPARAAPGASITITGRGWTPEDGPVTVFADAGERTDPDAALGRVDPAADGTLRLQVDVPDRSPGPLVLFACQRCSGGDAIGDEFPQATASFTVTAAAAPPRWWFLVAVATVVVLATAILLLLLRRPGRPRRARERDTDQRRGRARLVPHHDLPFRPLPPAGDAGTDEETAEEPVPAVHLTPHGDSWRWLDDEGGAS